MASSTFADGKAKVAPDKFCCTISWRTWPGHAAVTADSATFTAPPSSAGPVDTPLGGFAAAAIAANPGSRRAEIETPGPAAGEADGPGGAEDLGAALVVGGAAAPPFSALARAASSSGLGGACGSASPLLLKSSVTASGI